MITDFEKLPPAELAKEPIRRINPVEPKLAVIVDWRDLHVGDQILTAVGITSIKDIINYANGSTAIVPEEGCVKVHYAHFDERPTYARLPRSGESQLS
jgi:hypothetical protein